MLKLIDASDLLIDTPLDEALFDANGRLLLDKGVVISSTMKSKLLQIGYRVVTDNPHQAKAGAQAETSKQSCFATTQYAAHTLRVILSDFLAGRHLDAFAERIQSLAIRLIQACQTDPEAAIAAVHLYHEGDYAIRHHLSVGVVTAVLAQTDDRITAEDGRWLVCAALTHDVGIVHLANTDARLSEEERELIQRHPTLSSSALQQVGIVQPIWLDAVSQHHERLDGSGYPYKLDESSISLPGRLLAVADVYCAMTRPRPYRARAYFAMAAMRDLYVEQSHQLDHGLIQLLIKTLGLIPPGSLVKLKNGETAVVKKCCTQGTPLSYALMTAAGAPIMPPERRDTKDSSLTIVGRVDPEGCQHLQGLIRSLWA